MPPSTALVILRNNPPLNQRMSVASRPESQQARVWFETLEPRLLFSGLAAAIKLDLNFGRGGFAPLSESGANVTSNTASIATTTRGDFYALHFSFTAPSDSGSITRYRSDGSIDATFGTSGTLTIPPPKASSFSLAMPFESCYDLAVQTDGKLLVLESGMDVTFRFITRVLRFNVDGTTDAGFGTNGMAVIDRTGLYVNNPLFRVQSDGQIIVWDAPAIYRLTANGVLDSTFGNSSPDNLLASSEFQSPIVQLPDGTMIAYLALTTDGDPMLIDRIIQYRFNSTDGSAEEKITHLQPSHWANPVIQPDGQLLLEDTNFRMIRIRLDAKIDAVFGERGKHVPADGSLLAALPDGKILANVDVVGSDGASYSGVQRLNRDGSPDSSYAGGQFALSNVLDGVNIAATIPDGGTPNAIQLADDSAVATDSSFSLGASSFTVPPLLANPASAGQVYRGIFATASGATLFNPDGTSSVFEDANTIARL